MQNNKTLKDYIKKIPIDKSKLVDFLKELRDSDRKDAYNPWMDNYQSPFI